MLRFFASLPATHGKKAGLLNTGLPCAPCLQPPGWPWYCSNTAGQVQGRTCSLQPSFPGFYGASLPVWLTALSLFNSSKLEETCRALQPVTHAMLPDHSHATTLLTPSRGCIFQMHWKSGYCIMALPAALVHWNSDFLSWTYLLMPGFHSYLAPNARCLCCLLGCSHLPMLYLSCGWSTVTVVVSLAVVRFWNVSAAPSRHFGLCAAFC